MRRTLEDCAPGGHFIPSITYGLPGAVFPQVDAAIDARLPPGTARLTCTARGAPPSSAAARPRPAAASAPAAAAAESAGVLGDITAALRKGRRKKVLEGVEAALAEGISAETVLNEGLVRGMQLLGDDFSAGRAFVPEMLVAARAMNAATERLKPLLAAGGKKSAGKICLGTVRGDMHDIGKNLVKIMMEGAGLEVVDLGVDVSAEQFVDTAVNEGCALIGCSAMLTTTMDEMRRVVELVRERGLAGKVKVMIGGAPTSREFCDSIGADCYTADAAQAARRPSRCWPAELAAEHCKLDKTAGEGFAPSPALRFPGKKIGEPPWGQRSALTGLWDKDMSRVPARRPLRGRQLDKLCLKNSAPAIKLQERRPSGKHQFCRTHKISPRGHAMLRENEKEAARHDYGSHSPGARHHRRHKLGQRGLFRFDIVAWLCGGPAAVFSRVIYTLVGLAALWCISLLFRPREEEA